jgi:hypothetical protein
VGRGWNPPLTKIRWLGASKVGAARERAELEEVVMYSFDFLVGGQVG